MIGTIVAVAMLLVFPAGWILLGVSALRVTGPAIVPRAA